MKAKVTIIILLFAITAKGQISSVYNQFWNERLLLNPGMSGLTNNWNRNGSYGEFALTYHNQWIGFEGAPKRCAAYLHGKSTGFFGFGGFVYRYSKAVVNEYYMSLPFSFHFKGSRTYFFTFGLAPVVIYRNFDGSNLKTETPENDFPFQNNNKINFDANFGATFYNQLRQKSKRKSEYLLGISLLNMMQLFNSNKSSENNPLCNLHFEYQRYTNRKTKDNKKAWKFSGDALVNLTLLKNSIFTGNITYFIEPFRLGAGIRSNMESIVFIGFEFQKFDINMSYGFNFNGNKTIKYNWGSPEVTLKFKWD